MDKIPQPILSEFNREQATLNKRGRYTAKTLEDLCVPKIGFGVDAGNKRGKLAA